MMEEKELMIMLPVKYKMDKKDNKNVSVLDW